MNKLKLQVARWKFYYTRHIRVHLIYFLLFTALAINAYSYMLWKNEWNYQSSLLGEAYIIREVVATPASASTDEVTHKDWIKKTIEDSGLKWKDVECLINHESSFNEFSYYVNGDKSVDRGLWAWNDKWNKHISNDCAFNYKCSTIEAIIKIKKDGGYGAWHGYTSFCK